MFFLPLIADAIGKPGRKNGVQEVFEEIERQGKKPEYRRGLRQFQMFMMEVYKNIEARSIASTNTEVSSLICDLQLQVIAGVFKENRDQEQACLDLINSRPVWERQFEIVCSEWKRAEPTQRATRIIIDKDGEAFRTVLFERRPLIKTVAQVTPGQYGFRLETGRVFGEDRFTRDDLLWAYAHPACDLRLAADTSGVTSERPTREFELLGGEVIVRVFPEIDYGRMELSIGK